MGDVPTERLRAITVGLERYLRVLRGLHGPAQLRLFAALPMLMDAEGGLDMKQAEIAREVGMTPSSVSRAMRDLEGMGVVQRRDGRRRLSPQLMMCCTKQDTIRTRRNDGRDGPDGIRM